MAMAGVPGWTATKDAKLETKDGVYLLMSTGVDPTAAPASGGPVGPFAISFEMVSNSRSSG
ncbi:MAG: hypothetical protein C0467_20625 [Planctomycetaceae bacterium]|nr:hypothetical protein [Planctomycetaceae bacterium]